MLSNNQRLPIQKFKLVIISECFDSSFNDKSFGIFTPIYASYFEMGTYY